ncbi:MAG: glycosyltransferase family 2 protein [bacterium]
MKLSILIPVFNNLNYTKTCLLNLKSQLVDIDSEKEKIYFEIVLIDDGSKDGTYQWVLDNYKNVHILRGDGKLWWSGSINLGTKYAINELKTDYILWWNNDIIAGDNYFMELMKIIKNNTDYHLIGSKVFRLNENLIWGMGGTFNPKTGIKYMNGERQSDNQSYKKSLHVDWFPGMGTTIHKNVFIKIGLLDNKRFPQYHGDSDFTFRAKKAGFNLIAYPGLRIYNDVSNSGLIHKGSVNKLFQSMISIKSNYNLKKDFLFYRIHTSGILPYKVLIIKYSRYVGGFFKWKILNVLGIKSK